jgi:hypothetical protein
MKNVGKIFLVAALALFSFSLYAQQQEVLTFTRIERNPRAAGLAGAGAASSAFSASLFAQLSAASATATIRITFFINFKNLKVDKALFYFLFRLFAKNGAKILSLLHISKKNCNFAQ